MYAAAHNGLIFNPIDMPRRLSWTTHRAQRTVHPDGRVRRL